MQTPPMLIACRVICAMFASAVPPKPKKIWGMAVNMSIAFSIAATPSRRTSFKSRRSVRPVSLFPMLLSVHLLPLSLPRSLLSEIGAEIDERAALSFSAGVHRALHGLPRLRDVCARGSCRAGARHRRSHLVQRGCQRGRRAFLRCRIERRRIVRQSCDRFWLVPAGPFFCRTALHRGGRRSCHAGA